MITIPLNAYRSEMNAEVKVTEGIRSEYNMLLLCRAFKKTLTNERSRKWAHTQ